MYVAILHTFIYLLTWPVFRFFWRLSVVHNASYLSCRIESIDKMESDFKNCHMFLVTILNKAVCRGSFPHCESAAGLLNLTASSLA